MLTTTALVGLAGWGIWLLQPKEPVEGRPVAEVGAIQLRAEPLSTGGEDFSVWRGSSLTFKTPLDQSGYFQRVEVSSIDVDVAGGPEPDLVVYGWTGGAHCCFTRFVFDGRTGKPWGQFELGNSDGSPFVVPKAREDAKGVMVAVDDVFANHFGSFAGSPMGRILIIWTGQRFGLDVERMTASGPDGPPAYMTSDPDIAELGVTSDVAEDAMVESGKSNGRGDQAAKYQTFLTDLRTQLTQNPPRGVSQESWAPLVEVLNDYVYKGQADAGVNALQTQFKDDPELLAAIFGDYFSALKESRWYEDLDALNNGKLKTLETRFPIRALPAQDGVARPAP